MADVSRQQKRARLRAIDDRGHAVLRQGLERQPALFEQAAAAIALQRTLDLRTSSDSVVQFATKTVGLFEASLKRTPSSAAIACKKGCNWCCYLPVSATVPEILLVAGARRGKPVASAEVATGQKRPCPVLATEGCSTYQQRPLMCRVANSLDVNACIDEFEGRNPDVDIPVARTPITQGANARVTVLAAIELAGLDATLYDLAGGLARVVDVEDAARRWRAGERIFEGVASVPVDPPVAAMVTKVVMDAQALLA